MDVAALWISLVAAMGTGAAAIIAWVSRADALKAQTSADEAKAAAVDAWKRAADALEEANGIQLKITAEAIEREQLIRRTEVAEALRQWYAAECARVNAGLPASSDHLARRRSISAQLSTGGEPGNGLLSVLLRREAKGAADDDAVDMAIRALAGLALIREWEADPEAFAAAHEDDLAPDELVTELAEAAVSWQTNVLGKPDEDEVTTRPEDEPR